MGTYLLSDVMAPSSSTYTLDDVKASDVKHKATKEDQGILSNLLYGALKGSTDLGTTLLWPVDKAMDVIKGDRGVTLSSLIDGKAPMSRHDERKAALQSFYEDNANPDSLTFKGGALATGIAGTAGAGGMIAKGMGAAPGLASAVASGGFRLGGAPATTGMEVAKNAATRIAGGAINGGVSAGLLNPEDVGTGAAIGAVMPVAARTGAELGMGVKAALWDPIVNQSQIIAGVLQRAVGSQNAPNVISNLGKAASTPGVKFSAGESSMDPAIAAIEDALRAVNPGGALNRNAVTNRGALADTMRGIAQDDAALTAAKEARKLASKPLYDSALDPANQQQLTPWVKGQITQLLKRPSINSASKDAQIAAMERGEKPTAEGSLQALHDVKQSLDDAISQARREGLDFKVSTLMGTKEKLMSVMDHLSPDYRAANNMFASMSQPINKMQVGKLLSEKLIPSTSGDIPATLNAAQLATALRNPDQVARLATKFPGATLENTLGNSLPTVRGVSDDASRIAEAMKLGNGYGSPTARRNAVSGYIGQHIAEQSPTISRIISGLGGLPVMGHVTGGISALGGMLGKSINADMAQKLETMLASDPAGTRAALVKLLSGSNPTGLLGGNVGQLGGQAALLGGVGLLN